MCLAFIRNTSKVIISQPCLSIQLMGHKTIKCHKQNASENFPSCLILSIFSILRYRP